VLTVGLTAHRALSQSLIGMAVSKVYGNTAVEPGAGGGCWNWRKSVLLDYRRE
jgi:hypothetical protein